jgi:hypothetical protein
MTPPRSRRLGAVAVAAGGLPAGLLLADGHPVLRGLAAAFLLAAPALATMALLPGLPTLGRLVCGLVAAVVVNGLVAETALESGLWSITVSALVVSVVSAVLWALAGPAPSMATGDPPESGSRESGPRRRHGGRRAPRPVATRHDA